jgi:hypothetical protein
MSTARVRLAGRQTELAQVDRWLSVDRAASAVRGAVLSGPTGIGRTSMLRAVGAVARARGCHVVEAAGSDDVTRHLPFGAIAAALAHHGIRAGQLTDVDALLHTASRLEAAAGPHRLVVLLDNVHLADDGTVSLAGLLVRGGAFLVSAVPEGVALPLPVHELWRGGLLEWLDLGPLDTSAIAELATELTGKRVSPATAAELTRVTSGNPLFAREVVRAAVDQSLVTQERLGCAASVHAPADRTGDGSGLARPGRGVAGGARSGRTGRTDRTGRARTVRQCRRAGRAGAGAGTGDDAHRRQRPPRLCAPDPSAARGGTAPTPPGLDGLPVVARARAAPDRHRSAPGGGRVAVGPLASGGATRTRTRPSC